MVASPLTSRLFTTRSVGYAMPVTDPWKVADPITSTLPSTAVLALRVCP